MTKRKRKRGYWVVYAQSGGRFEFYTTKKLVAFLKTQQGCDSLIYWNPAHA